MSQPSHRISAIDLGTNSFHAVIVEIYPDGTYVTLDDFKEMIYFGDDVAEHYLSEEAMQRGLEALRKIKILSERKNVEKYLAYATSAIRESRNGGEFIQRVIDELQIKIMAIPGEMEAELIGHAVQHAVSLGTDQSLIMDIGGGSVEFIIANNQEFFFLDSLKIGVSRTAHLFIKNDPIRKGEVELIRAFYTKALEDVQVAVTQFPVKTLVGSSGTMQNIATMVAAQRKSDVSVTLNQFEYTAEEFKRFYQSFIGLNRKERLEVSGLDTKRVDFILPGLILTDLVIDLFGIESIRTSTDALREGMILHYIKKQTPNLSLLAQYPDPRRRSIFELVRRCNWYETHSVHVSKIALRLFDELRLHHDCNDNDRELLEYACYLHDIGYHISHKKHHRHALYIIRNVDLKGFTQEEIEIMAHVSRYHRRSTPKKRHEEYAALAPETRRRIKKLSAFMRVADGLDRSHFQNVSKLRTRVLMEHIVIEVESNSDPDLEIWGAMRKRELFEELFARTLDIRQVMSLPESASVV